MNQVIAFFLGIFIVWSPVLLLLTVGGIIYGIFKIPDLIRQRKFNKKFQNYLRAVNDNTINEQERKEFLSKYGTIVQQATPSHLRCGNPLCGCDRIKVSHHMYNYG